MVERASWGDLGRTVLRLAASGLLAVGLAAIFLLPLLLEQRFMSRSQWVQGSYSYRGHFVYLSQSLIPSGATAIPTTRPGPTTA